MTRPLHSVKSPRTTMTDADYRALMVIFGFGDLATFRTFVAEQQRKQDRGAR